MQGDGSEVPVQLTVTVNGARREVPVEPLRTLASFLRDDLGMTGTKISCEVGVCGACTVLVDGRPASSCSKLAVEADGCDVLTVEGLADLEPLQGLQEAFIREGGFQCGFCTSGQLMAAAALLRCRERGQIDEEEIREQLAGNLCRCTGYYGIVRAIASLVQ